MVGNGRGSSKKLAKGRAARALLDKLDDRVPHWEGNNVKPPIAIKCMNIDNEAAIVEMATMLKTTNKRNLIHANLVG